MGSARGFQAVCSAEGGGEDNAVLGPVDGWVVALKPWRTKDDGVAANIGNVETDVLGVGADLESQGDGLVGDGTGSNRTAVSNLQLLRRSLELEIDGVTMDKGGVDEGRGGTGVDQGKSRNRDTADNDNSRESTSSGAEHRNR